VVLLCGALGLQLRQRRAERARAAARAAVSLELTYDVLAGRAAERAFAAALDRAVRALSASGARIGAALPEPRAAVLRVPGLGDDALRRALDGLPLDAGPISPGGEVRITLRPEDADRIADAALQDTARQLRARALGAHPCDGCVPVVVVHGAGPEARLVLRLPWIDDIAERRLRAAIDAAPPPPAPLSFAGARVVREVAAAVER